MQESLLLNRTMIYGLRLWKCILRREKNFPIFVERNHHQRNPMRGMKNGMLKTKKSNDGC
ncbi:hypothetical protein Patl1_23872 [Pistacia atlantica]|uniref:Uncharacterized protein n=1 Tax=Pistacia atlantica TaxID=434234 RepID=A0ACC0ZXI4_9ROSI|nr:hypothetical protein Patl1_23872 [Pistacia atlantica]